ncbi:MAG TPA: hypothetical protein VFS10_11680 [Pyrinomonadaceae bacterium]|nr:hypothetical protein [Pyrinomonadaceae bacterium]
MNGRTLISNRRAVFLSVAAGLLVAGCLLFAGRAGAQGGGAKVLDSILGVRIGSSLEEAHAKLKDLGTVGGRATREGGRKEAWTLKGGEFTSIAYKTDASGRVVWLTGFVRPGKEIPFSQLGDLARANGKDETEAAWTVEAPGGGGYRLVAKGPKGKARVVYLLSLEAPPVR